MTWLRLFNPFHARRLERQHAQLLDEHAALKVSSAALASRTKELAASTIRLVDAAEHRGAESEKALTEAAVGINNMRDTLQMIADDMACGKTARAKTMVDALILVIEGPKN